MEQGKMHSGPGGGERTGERVALPGRLAVGEPPHGDPVDELHRLKVRGREHGDVGRPFDAPVQRTGEQCVVIPRGDEYPHRLPGIERVGQEAARVDARALVFVQVTRDRHRHAALFDGQTTGTRERIAEPLPASPGELPLTAHGGEHPVEVEVGKMEETCRHGAENESGDLEANVSSQRLPQVYRPIFWHNWPVPAR